MSEWAKDQESQNVALTPDGNGEFTEQLGMLVDKSDLGFGKRSWRYSTLVKDRVIAKQFIEPEKPGDPFEVSDADTMMNFINPQAKKPDQVAIFTCGCGSFCAEAKATLSELGYDHIEIALQHQIRSKVIGAVTGQQTVPQVFINAIHIGDAEALMQWARKAA